MTSVTIPRAAAVGAVIGAILLVQLARAPSDVSMSVPFEIAPLPPIEEPVAPAAAEPAASQGEPPAIVTHRELEAMSETFRNSTFLIAIRDAGFVCDHLLRVVGGLDDSPKWLASCSDMLAYTVGIASNGTLHVEPMLQYMDGIRPGVQPRLEPGGEILLPPQQLPQPVPPPR